MITLRHILVATDFGGASRAALQYGTSLARAHGSVLHLLHVVGDASRNVAAARGPAPRIARSPADVEAEARRRLDALLSVEDRAVCQARVVALSSPMPARAILDYIEEQPIDLAIVGAYGQTGIDQLFVGSVAQHIVRLASCPVLTVRQTGESVRPETAQETWRSTSTA